MWFNIPSFSSANTTTFCAFLQAPWCHWGNPSQVVQVPFMGVLRENRDRKPWIFPFKMGLSGDNFPFQSIDMGDGHQSLFGVLDGFAIPFFIWIPFTIVEWPGAPIYDVWTMARMALGLISGQDRTTSLRRHCKLWLVRQIISTWPYFRVGQNMALIKHAFFYLKITTGWFGKWWW